MSMADQGLILRAKAILDRLAEALTAYQLVAAWEPAQRDPEAMVHAERSKLELEALLRRLLPREDVEKAKPVWPCSLIGHRR